MKGEKQVNIPAAAHIQVLDITVRNPASQTAWVQGGDPVVTTDFKMKSYRLQHRWQSVVDEYGKPAKRPS